MSENVPKMMQFMLSHGCVTSSELFTFLATLRPANASQLSEENAARSIENINGKIKRFNMMIRSAYDTNTRQIYYALISTVDNEITRQASHHTEKEFEYFRLIWQELQEGPKELEELHRIGKDLKLTNYKNLIVEWQQKHWLYVNEDSVNLGIRSKLELDVLISMFRQSTSSGPDQSNSVIDADDDDDDDED